MIDLQVVFPQEAVLLTNVRLLPGPVPAVEVRGDDFRSVDTVLINDVPSPDVVVLSPNSLLAQVPSTVSTTRVLSVTVLSKKLVMTGRSLLRFELGRTVGKISGLQRLVQQFLKILFTTPGRDIFHKRLGAGALTNIGGSYGIDDGGNLVNDFIIAVNQTVRQLVAIQSRKTNLSQEERLMNARVKSAGFNADAGGLDVVVEITSQAGTTAVTSVGI